jgi:hypothetical protein
MVFLILNVVGYWDVAVDWIMAQQACETTPIPIRYVVSHTSLKPGYCNICAGYFQKGLKPFARYVKKSYATKVIE